MFGEVLEGKSIVRKIEGLTTQADKPTSDATIVGKTFYVSFMSWMSLV